MAHLDDAAAGDPAAAAAAASPRKSFLSRSASWAAGRPPPSRPHSQPASRPLPRPARLALPSRPSTHWPGPAYDDSTPTSANSHSPALSSPDAADISHITTNLYLGSDSAASDLSALRRRGITHVLNCAGAACADHFAGEFTYLTLFLHDSLAEDLAAVLYDAFDFFESAADAGGRAFAHCVRGASRSASIVLAYLMWKRSLPFDAALRHVRAARPAADPNLGFVLQLLKRQPTKSPSGVVMRVLRVAPHSPHAPLYLVPKTVTAGSGGIFDSRGAFLVHVKDTVFVWLGKGCMPEMSSAAAKTSAQMMKYENTVDSIVTVYEGAESESFWSAIGDEDSSHNDHDARIGKRRVQAYDFDFEIFHHALKAQREEMVGSSTPSSSSSTDLTSSPLSSPSSSWYSPPTTPDRSDSYGAPRNQYRQLKLPVLHCSEEGEKDISLECLEDLPSDTDTDTSWCIGSRPLAELRGVATSLTLPMHMQRGQLAAKPFVEEGCSSPTFIPDVEGEVLDFEKQLSLVLEEPSNVQEEESESSECQSLLVHPVLFSWPEMNQIEEIHPGVLDSKSVLLMLAPRTVIGLKKPKGKILYVWLGNISVLSKEDKSNRRTQAEEIAMHFLSQIGESFNIPTEVVMQGEEPEQFLNHLFSFHQITGKECSEEQFREHL